MKNTLFNLLQIVFMLLLVEVKAGNYKDKVFKSDSSFTVFRETQIGKNFFNTTNNNYSSYSTKLGIQMYCFQAGVGAEREFNFTQANSNNYFQRNKSYGAFFGIELPITSKLNIGVLGSASFYKTNLERPIYIATSNKLFEINYDNIYQAQLRFNYKLNKAFSLLGTTNFNLNQINGGVKYFDENNFFRLNFGLRYTVFPDLITKNLANESSRIKIFAGTQLEWKNENLNNFTGQIYKVADANLLKLVEAGSENSKSLVFPLLGLVGKRNNMILLGYNQRNFTQFSPGYGQVSSASNWRMEMNVVSSRLAFEFNLLSFSGKKVRDQYKSFYPFYRLTSTYSQKNFYFKNGWDYTNYGLNSFYYVLKAENKAETKSLEINNSLGLALRLKKLFLSSGFNIFNRTYGEVNYQSTVVKGYYYDPNSTNIQAITETLPELNTKGWLGKAFAPINLFFTIGLVL